MQRVMTTGLNRTQEQRALRYRKPSQGIKCFIPIPVGAKGYLGLPGITEDSQFLVSHCQIWMDERYSTGQD